MIERDMEDLIAAYPEDFFPRQRLALKGRQKAFVGVGRFDLLFEDEFQTNILMELKAVPAKYEDATQLAKYKEELEKRGEKNILMWLVSPQISTSIREFLERIGIEYTEVHFSECRRIAAKHGAVIQSEVHAETADDPSAPKVQPRDIRKASPNIKAVAEVAVGPVVTRPSKFRWKAYSNDLALLNPEDFEKSKFDGLIESFQQAVPSGRNRALVTELMTWAADPRHSRWPHGANCSLLRWVTTTGWKTAVPQAHAIWRYLFGQPVPTWYVWRQRGKKYEFDAKGWSAWYESLTRSLKSVEAIYKEHNASNARDWPVDKQCQCKDCESYREAHPSGSSL